MTTRSVHMPRRCAPPCGRSGHGRTDSVASPHESPIHSAVIDVSNSAPRISSAPVVPGPLQTIVQTVSTLSASTVDAMYALHCHHFDNDDRDRFRADLAAKQWVILVKPDDDRVVGFSTIQELRLDCGNGPVAFMFSGDTIVDPSAWGANALPPAIAYFISRFMEGNAGMACYWFLICKGYRTYRCLPLFFNRFIPACAGPVDKEDARLLDLVARHKFGGQYNAHTGAISHPQPLDYLNDALRIVPEHRADDPHIRFFFDRNPGWTRGDELACLARLSEANLRRSARRVIEAGRRSVQWRV
jgi:hypothetical protein